MPRRSYRLRHVPEALFDRYLDFGRRHPGIGEAAVLSKLTIFDFVYPILERVAPDDILEIGAGQGVHSSLLSEFGNVSATELASPAPLIAEAELLRERVFAELPRRPIEFKFNDGRALPYDDASFDVVFHNSVIEHVPDVVEFNREVRRVLRPGGVCIAITGTRRLCIYRFVRYYLLRLPALFAVNMLRTRGMAGRLRKLRGPTPAEVPDISLDDARELLPRLYHYVRSPDYNRILVENMAAEHGASVDGLLEALARHFERSPRLWLELCARPRTHGQHYRDWRHEADEWRIERWRQSFETAGYDVEEIIGYRLQHLLEVTWKASWNARLAYHFTPQVHARLAAGKLPPHKATEFVLVARAT